MRKSTNYEMNLFEEDDFYTEEQFNENTEKIDEVLNDLENPKHDTTTQTNVEELTSGESIKVALRKLAKAVADYISHKADKVAHITAEERTAWNAKLGAEKIAANLVTDTDGMVLAAAMGKNLQEQISTLNSNLSTSKANIQADTTKEIAFAKGRYLLHFSQNGMWPRNGLAYLDFTGYTEGSYFSWLCDNLKSMLTVEISSTGLTITTTTELGVGINLSYTRLRTL